MRLIGAVMLTGAGLLAGLTTVSRMRLRAERQACLCRMLALLEFELSRFRTPLPELFAVLAGQLAEPAASLCRRVEEGLSLLGMRSFSEIWGEALRPLPETEAALLLPLGQVLGRYGAEEQLQAVAACRREMERSWEDSRRALRERGRVYVGLSAAGGALLSVLLL